jgi:pantetheine-phosphate adenylyltransferase
MKEKIAVFPGSFDPFTLGHENIVQRALVLFDKIIIALGENSSKKYFFDTEKRYRMIHNLYKDNSQIEVDVFKGLTVDFCKEKGAHFLLRGLRNSSDFNYESTIAMLNNKMGDGIETVFLITDPGLSFYSSTVVRDFLKAGKDCSSFLAPAVWKEILKEV